MTKELKKEEMFNSYVQFWHTFALGISIGAILGLTFGIWATIKFIELGK